MGEQSNGTVRFSQSHMSAGRLLDYKLYFVEKNMLFPSQLLKTSPYEWNTVDVITLDELSVWKVMVVCVGMCVYVRVCVCVYTPRI